MKRLSLSSRRKDLAVQTWDLTELDAPSGMRDPLVLFSSDGGRALMIRLDPGQELGDHQVKERAWIAVVEGQVQASAGHETKTCAPGTLLTFDPDERHSLGSDTGARILMLLAPWPGEGHYRGQRERA
jgi:quercetin dioxygenase-like cupin family protein